MKSNYIKSNDSLGSKQIIAISTPDFSSKLELPIFISSVKAGFPSPATDYEEAKLDLNTHLIHNPNSTFFVHIDGNSMIDAKIQSGDIAIVDRSLEAKSGDVILAVIDGDFTIKRLDIRDIKGEVITDPKQKNLRLTIQTHNTKQIRLLPENPNFEPILITGNMTFVVWGVVTSVIHKMRI